ncbi:MAG TPA: glycosyltransferase [Bradyrhizobium sp.]|nr:glycosyltransferase [Bradyrhizobium sp.]
MIEPIVCVPARNEAKRLPHLLRSLRQQTWLRENTKSLRTVIVLNNCDDDSASILRRIVGELPQLSVHLIERRFAPRHAHVGSARRLAMDRGFALAPNNSVLLTTDADAIPRHDWIDANLRAISDGADLVGGYIIGDKDEEALLGPGFVRRAARHLYYARLVDRLTSLVRPIPHDPWPRHCDHTGASLAVRREVYAAVGGMPALPFREDLAFVERVCRAGFRLRHSLDVQVTVSARLDGRAAGGMSDCLKAWLAAEESGLPHLVEDPQAIIVRLQQNRAPAAVIRLPVDEDRLRPKSGVDHNGILANRASESVEIELAINELRRIIADKEGEAHVRGSATLDFLQRVD